MYINKTYIGKLNGIFGVWCGFKPNNAIITQEKIILYADQGKTLRHKESGVENISVLLENGDTEENYEEIERNTPNDIINENLSALDSREQ